MQYMLLIRQGNTPTPYDAEAWKRLSEDERALHLSHDEAERRLLERRLAELA
jgi:hypothetical protein